MKPKFYFLKLSCLITFSMSIIIGCTNIFGADDNPFDPKSNNYTEGRKAITTFSFPSSSVTGTISGTTIEVNVPYGTNVTELVATFIITGKSITVGATAQVSGVTANDFSNPVVYNSSSTV